ncbi:MAG: branched-chain amino acid ABC transporter permease [Clostridiales bacterium]|nr:branched-chain amino acid ABC transporter permease [Clostridiales bacterium]
MNTTERTNFFQGKIFAILGVLILLVVPNFVSTNVQIVFILILFYGLCASCWNIVCGFVGELSLGHAVFLGFGAYISTLLLMDGSLSPWVGMFIAAIITAAFGVIVGLPCFRLHGPYFALTTIALGELIRIFVENNEKVFGINIRGAMGLVLKQTGNQFIAFEFANKITYYYVLVAFVAVTILVTWLIKNSKLGYYLTAIKSDPDAAESLGIKLTKYKLIAMAISCFMISFAGTFYAQYFRYVGPTRIFSHDMSVQIALIALVGGQGTVFGPLLGACLLVPITEFLSEEFGGTMPGLHLFIYGIMMVLVVLYMPQGIYKNVTGFFKKLEYKIFGWDKANRKSIGKGVK